MFGLISIVAAAGLAAAPAPAVDRPVQVGRGDQAIHGSLLQPAGARRGPAVLMISGSGPEDRNGDDLKDGLQSQAMRLLAVALAERGVPSLRFDKRGVGESAPAGSPPSIGTLVDDAAGLARLLGRQPGVRCVVVLGHSEGALLAALTAQRTRVCGVVLVAGASRDLGDIIEAQGALLRRSPEMTAKVHEIILALRSGKPVVDPPPELAGVFGPDAEGYTRSEISLDPTAEAAKVKVPVLVLQGDNDLQASVDDAKRLAAASGGKLVVIPGMTHVLKVAPRDIGKNIETYKSPDLPLAPGVVDAVTDFVEARR